MRLRNFLGIRGNRQQSLITCTSEIKKEVTGAMIMSRWKFNDFATFLELMGIKPPVELCNMQKNRFQCISSEGKVAWISFFYPDTQIKLEEKEQIRIFAINQGGARRKPEVFLIERCTREADKILHSHYYYNLLTARTLYIDKQSSLKVDIYVKDLGRKEYFETLLMQNFEKLEDYLITLDNSLKVEKVYEEVIKRINMTKDELTKIGIFISHMQEGKNENSYGNPFQIDVD